MIRHAGGAACAITALMIAMIETACRGLLMATIGGSTLRTARLFTTRQTAIDLPAFAGWTVLTRSSENTANEEGGLRSAQPPDEKPRLRLQPGLRFSGKTRAEVTANRPRGKSHHACGDEGAPAAMKLVNTNLRKKCSAPAAMRKGRHQFKFIRSQMIADTEVARTNVGLKLVAFPKAI